MTCPVATHASASTAAFKFCSGLERLAHRVGNCDATDVDKRVGDVASAAVVTDNG